MSVTPRKIERLGEAGIKVLWSDGVEHEIPSRILREHCPSAPERAKRGDTSHDKPISTGKPSALNIVQSSIDEELRLDEIWGIGNYAIGMKWGDGHSTGIYNYALLRELGELSGAPV